MCLRLIAETDARAVGDSHPSCYYFALTLLVGHRVLNADTMSIKQKMNKPLSFPVVLALTLQVEWQEGYPAHKNPVVVPVSLSFVRVLDHLGLKGHKMVVVVVVSFYYFLIMFYYFSLCVCFIFTF